MKGEKNNVYSFGYSVSHDFIPYDGWSRLASLLASPRYWNHSHWYFYYRVFVEISIGYLAHYCAFALHLFFYWQKLNKKNLPIWEIFFIAY